MSEPWGDSGYAHRGGENSKDTPYPLSDPKPWRKMIPVKRYEHFTRFYKQLQNGEGYYECFLNRDIDADMKMKGLLS